MARRQRLRPVRRDVRRNHVQALQIQGEDRGVGDVDVALVDRIEGAAQDADATGRHGVTWEWSAASRIASFCQIVFEQRRARPRP